MTKEELIRQLSALANADREWAHGEGERLLLKFIDDDDITLAWDELSSDWWYA